MHNLYESKEAVYIVTDLASGGELFQQLLKKGSYTEKDASNLTRQMLEGLHYLHERDVSFFFFVYAWVDYCPLIRFFFVRLFIVI
jgi:serine/threonine protein kinase